MSNEKPAVMKSPSCTCLILMFSAAAAMADPYDFALVGYCFSSRDQGTAYSGTLTNGSFEQFPRRLENVAEAPNGRVFGFLDFDLMELHPYRTITLLFADVSPIAPIHMVVAADATVNIAGDPP